MHKRYLAELVGTFIIVIAPVAFASHGETGLLGAAWVSGLSVMAMIYALGSISGAHFNPAVTIAFAAAKRFNWREVFPYWLMQFLGASLAATVSFVLFGQGVGAHIPKSPHLIVMNLGLEVLLGFFLMFTIMGVATNPKVASAVPGIAIGLAVVCGVLIGGPITGGSMNPARSFGPALFVKGALDHYWIYLIGPSGGAVLAAVLYGFLTKEPDGESS